MTAVVCFCPFERLCVDPLRGRFLSLKNCRNSFIDLVLKKMSCDTFLESILNVHLSCNHSVTDLVKSVIFQTFNCMAKRLSKDLTESSMKRRRKIHLAEKGKN